MKLQNVPPVGSRYWLVIVVASVFGANLGDFVSHDLHGGHWRGLLPLAAIFATILLLERRSPRRWEGWYWLAIVTLRTAATNLADLMTHDARLGYPAVVAALAVLLTAVVRLGRPPATAGLPPTNGLYWLAMLLAGTLGTAAGDAVADRLGLGVGLGTAVLGALLLALLALRRARAVAAVAGYWITIVAVRMAGTTGGDLLAGTLGLPWSTLATGALLAGILLAWTGQRHNAPGLKETVTTMTAKS